jgi:ParB-like chromosome segregation protein Spo0J
MQTTPIKQLKAHPAQMRTTYDPESLATLTLQLFERGLDSWQPIVAAPHDDAYYLVSGHRRQMAQLLAFALRDWAAERPDREITIEVVRTMVNTLVESLESLEKVMASLLTRYGDEEIPFVLFEGSQKAQILALHAANYGSEKPDMLGVAHSFRQAVEAGATPEEIARNVGQHLNYVLNHLALAHIPGELAQRIAAGELPMSVATAVADLPEPKRTGLAIFILANPSTSSGQAGQLTAKAIKECAATLKKWPGLQMPLMVKHQSQRNIARALVHLWGQVVAAYPEDAYAAAAMFIYRGVQEEPWSAQEKLTLWFQALGGDTYFTEGRINWTAVVEYLITEVACESCPIGQLPQQQLRSDLSQGQGGPLGMPCRVGEAATRCIHGLAASDGVDVRVPWEWSGHPGVMKDGADYRVRSAADLQAAWQAQQEREAAEAAALAAESGDEPGTKTVVGPKTDPVQPQTKPTDASRKEGAVVTATANGHGQPASETPITKQRQRIARYMQTHEQFRASHPFATPCAACRHKLEQSPTQDEAVPHCAWAGRLRQVTFQELIPTVADAPRLLVCRQFAPNQPWRERIPAHPEPAGVPREWVKEQIGHLVAAANKHGSQRNAFEFLTGRPMGANEAYGDWFSQQLAEQSGELSDAQLFTLFVWAHAEWQRAHYNGVFSLPLNGQSQQFVPYQAVEWTGGGK